MSPEQNCQLFIQRAQKVMQPLQVSFVLDSSFSHQHSDTVLQTPKQEHRCNQPPYTTWNLGCFGKPKEKNTEQFKSFLFFSQHCIVVTILVTLLQSK